MAPVAPVAPVAPWGPVGPVGPGSPVAPWSPVAPVAPAGPVGPGSERSERGGVRTPVRMHGDRGRETLEARPAPRGPHVPAGEPRPPAGTLRALAVSGERHLTRSRLLQDSQFRVSRQKSHGLPPARRAARSASPAAEGTHASRASEGPRVPGGMDGARPADRNAPAEAERDGRTPKATVPDRRSRRRPCPGEQRPHCHRTPGAGDQQAHR